MTGLIEGSTGQGTYLPYLHELPKAVFIYRCRSPKLSRIPAESPLTTYCSLPYLSSGEVDDGEPAAMLDLETEPSRKSSVIPAAGACVRTASTDGYQ